MDKIFQIETIYDTPQMSAIVHKNFDDDFIARKWMKKNFLKYLTEMDEKESLDYIDVHIDKDLAYSKSDDEKVETCYTTITEIDKPEFVRPEFKISSFLETYTDVFTGVYENNGKTLFVFNGKIFHAERIGDKFVFTWDKLKGEEFEFFEIGVLLSFFEEWIARSWINLRIFDNLISPYECEVSIYKEL